MRFYLLTAGLVVVAAMLPLPATAERQTASWDAVPEILARIQPPEFPDRDFNVTDYGAIGGRRADSKPAFDKAIAACHAAGGGRVVVPAGQWRCAGPIHLKSGVNLHLESGATVFFSADPDNYLPLVFTRFEGNELMNYSPLIYAIDEQNIAITGSGTFDGQADHDHWWSWKGRWKDNPERGPHQGPAVEKLRQMADDDVPVSERVFGPGHYLRPNFVQIYRSKDVLIEGVTFTNSPMWVIHPVLCENVTIRGVTVNSHGPNSDGCNPESCRDVLIEDCTFDTGDDCIAIKSGRNADGRRLASPSENIVVRGCTMRDGHGGVVLGSEMSGGIRNVFVEDCDMDSPNLKRAIRLKSNSLRGGFLENMLVRNVRVGQVAEAVVRINLLYERGQGEHYPTVRNIRIENVTSEKSGRPFYLVGLENAKIESVVIENSTFQSAEKPSVFEHVESLELRNFRLLPREGLDHD